MKIQWRSLGCSIIVLASLAAAQDTRKTLTNADIVNMTKSSMSSQTIVLAIQQSPARFDTSPDALIELKKAGVADEVLNAMLVSVSTVSGPKKDDAEAAQLLQKVITNLGSREQLMAVRSLKIAYIRTLSDGTSLQGERVVIYPDRVYMSQSTKGAYSKVVITPEFSYQSVGKMTTPIAPPLLSTIRVGIRAESVYVAQHLAEFIYTCEGTEQIGPITATRLNGHDLRSVPDLNISLPLECRARRAVLDGEIV